MGQILRLSFDRFQIPSLRLGRSGNSVQKPFHISLDGSQGGTQVMGNPGDQALSGLIPAAAARLRTPLTALPSH